MYHPRFKLITPTNTVNLDPNTYSESDIDEDSHPYIKPPQSTHQPSQSLLASVKLKKRVEMTPQMRLKQEAVQLSSD